MGKARARPGGFATVVAGRVAGVVSWLILEAPSTKNAGELISDLRMRGLTEIVQCLAEMA